MSLQLMVRCTLVTLSLNAVTSPQVNLGVLVSLWTNVDRSSVPYKCLNADLLDCDFTVKSLRLATLVLGFMFALEFNQIFDLYWKFRV